MQEKMESQQPVDLIVSWVIVIAGGLVLLSGIYLGFITFNEARSILHDPAPLKKWVQLRDTIHSDSDLESGKAIPSDMISHTASNLIRPVGGYLMLFISIIFIWVLARIAIVLISRGGEIMLYGIKSFRTPTKSDH